MKKKSNHSRPHPERRRREQTYFEYKVAPATLLMLHQIFNVTLTEINSAYEYLLKHLDIMFAELQPAIYIFFFYK